MPIPGRYRPAAVFAVLAAALMLAIAGCGSSSSSSSASMSGSHSSANSPASLLKAAYAGTVEQPPTGTLTAPKGLSVWAISCGQIVPSCVIPTAATMAAGKSVGWSMHECDGQLNPSGWANCVRQAIAAKAKVIIITGVDCTFLSAPVAAARKAGIIVIGNGGFDCTENGGKSEYNATLDYLTNGTAQQWWEGIGKLQADWVIGKTDGKAKVLLLNFTDEVWGAMITAGFKQQLATCHGCSIAETVDMSNADNANGTMRTKFSTGLLQNPGVNAVVLPIDGWFSSGLATAITSSARASSLNVIGAQPTPGNITLIKEHQGEDATVAFDSTQGSYGAVDEAIRVLTHQPIVTEGIGYQVIDSSHLPSGPAYVMPNNYKAVYAKDWGASS